MDRNRNRNRAPREPREKKEFQEQVISIDRVARVVKGGRRFRFRALVVVGDGKKRVGVGSSKGADVQAAIGKAVEVAKKNVITINTYKTTIPHVSEAKHSGAHVLLKPAGPGTGLIAGGVVRTIIDVTGIQDILSKSIGSSNKVNIAHATVKALSELAPASAWVTRQGKPKKEAKPEESKAEKAPAKKATKATEKAKKPAKKTAKKDK